jgi:hypothetical protein
VSSNIGQNYPYGVETEAERAAAVAQALERFPELAEKIAAESTPLGDVDRDEHWWVWVCPTGDFSGRLHVAGYAKDAHAMYTVCPDDGTTFLR